MKKILFTTFILLGIFAHSQDSTLLGVILDGKLVTLGKINNVSVSGETTSSLDTSNFDGQLTSLENTVQKGFDVLDDIDSEDIPYSYDAVSTNVKAGIDSNRTGKLDNTITGRTGTSPQGILIQTESQITTDGDPESDEIVICSDCQHWPTVTSSIFDLFQTEKQYYDDSSADAATFTFNNLTDGANVIVKANRATTPSYSGATPVQVEGTYSFGTWPADEDVIVVYFYEFSTLKYYIRK